MTPEQRKQKNEIRRRMGEVQQICKAELQRLQLEDVINKQCRHENTFERDHGNKLFRECADCDWEEEV